MSHDALFQLGMGPVELDATQMEEAFAPRVRAAAAKVFCDVRRNVRSETAARAVAALSCTAGKRRGNSARALIVRAAPAPLHSQPQPQS